MWLFDISILLSQASSLFHLFGALAVPISLFLSTAEVDDEGNLAVVEDVSAPIWRAEKLAWQRSVNYAGAAST